MREEERKRAGEIEMRVSEREREKERRFRKPSRDVKATSKERKTGQKFVTEPKKVLE